MTKLLLTTIMVLAITGCATIPQDGETVKIKAKPEGVWNHTGVKVTSGDKVSVRYLRGQWRSNPHWGPTDAEGSSRNTAPDSYLLPGTPEGGLIGKVGGNSLGGGCEPFVLGNEGSVPPGREGELWLTVNDEVRPGESFAGFADNSGNVVVRITVER